jgi:hypothetical protein
MNDAKKKPSQDLTVARLSAPETSEDCSGLEDILQQSRMLVKSHRSSLAIFRK